MRITTSAHWSGFLQAAILRQNLSTKRFYPSIPTKYTKTILVIILKKVADDMHHATLPTFAVSDGAAGDLQPQSPPIPTTPIKMAGDTGEKESSTGAMRPMHVARDAGGKSLLAITIREKGAGDARQEDQSISPGNEDARTRTSTEYHEDHEPWETFQHKVAQLCRTLWPKHSKEQIVIEQMRGGEYNRVIGVCITGPSIQGEQETRASDVEKPEIPPGNYALRITRSDYPTVGREIAMIRFLNNRVSLPLPTVVHSDGPNNPLGFAYVL